MIILFVFEFFYIMQIKYTKTIRIKMKIPNWKIHVSVI